MGIIIIVSIVVIVLVAILLCFSIRKSKSKKIILEELQKYGEVQVSKKIYDYLVETDDTIYLIKVVYNFDNLEIAINSRNYWQFNDRVINSKKSGTKIKGIYDLINEKNLSFEKEYKKVYLIYPTSRILVKAVNESELAFIIPTMDCHGVNVIRFNELNEIIK